MLLSPRQGFYRRDASSQGAQGRRPCTPAINDHIPARMITPATTIQGLISFARIQATLQRGRPIFPSRQRRVFAAELSGISSSAAADQAIYINLDGLLTQHIGLRIKLLRTNIQGADGLTHFQPLRRSGFGQVFVSSPPDFDRRLDPRRFSGASAPEALHLFVLVTSA